MKTNNIKITMNEYYMRVIEIFKQILDNEYTVICRHFSKSDWNDEEDVIYKIYKNNDNINYNDSIRKVNLKDFYQYFEKAFEEKIMIEKSKEIEDYLNREAYIKGIKEGKNFYREKINEMKEDMEKIREIVDENLPI